MDHLPIVTTTRKLKPKQVLLYQGEVPRDIYLIEEGYVRSYVIAHNGDEKNVSIYSPGNFLPMGWAFGITPVAINYYETMTDCVVRVVAKEDFKLLVNDAEFAKTHLASMARQLMSANLQITSLAQIHAQDKILRTLYFLLTSFGDGKILKAKASIGIPLTQEDIARFAGLTRETTATEINKLKREKIIVVKSKVYTVDVPKLLAKLGENDYKDFRLGV